MPIFVFVLIAAMLTASNASAEQKFLVRLSNGDQLATSQVQDGGQFPGKFQIDGKPILDDPGLIRWISDTERPKPIPPSSYVELIGHDTISGEVTDYSDGLETPFEKLPPHLVLRKTGDLSANHDSVLRITLDHIRKIVWHRNARQQDEPGTIALRDGLTVKYRTLRWGKTGIQALTNDGLKTFSFSDLAELQLPEKEEWKSYLEQLVTLMPSLESTIIQIQTDDGQRLTASLERFRVANRGPQNRVDRWYQLLQPAWSLDPIVVCAQSICEWRFHPPDELPLTYFTPSSFRHEGVFGRNDKWQLDGNVLGGPLRSGNHQFGWGLGVQGSSELTFPMPAAAVAIRTKVGLDHLVEEGGCINVEILANSSISLFKQNNILGGRPVVDSDWRSLPQHDNEVKSVSLRTDMAHDGRPAGADPFDVRDIVDWFEPEIRLDRSKMQREINDSVKRSIPGLEGWSISPAAAESLEFQNRATTGTEPETTSFRIQVRPKDSTYRLERELKVQAADRFVVIVVSRQPDSSPTTMAVQGDEKSLGRFDVPIRESAADPQPILIPIDPAASGRLVLRIDVQGRDDRSWVDWQSVSVAQRDPGILPLFEDDPSFANHLKNETGTVEILSDDVYSGNRAIKVSSGSAENHQDMNWNALISEHPRLGEFRYLVFAWKKPVGSSIQLQFAHQSLPAPRLRFWEIGWPQRQQPPSNDERGKRFGYCYEVGVASTSPPHPLWMHGNVPRDWEVVERDVFNDFGRFAITGIAFRTGDSNPAWFDHVYLARTKQDVERIKTLVTIRH